MGGGAYCWARSQLVLSRMSLLCCGLQCCEGRPVDDPAQRQRELLLVEDNRGDARLFAECLRTLPFPYYLSIVTDGDAALAFLQQHAPYTAAPRPDLILLDIHPLKTSGWEVLEWLRTQPVLADIPVVMWGGRLSPFDEQERERLRPTQCLTKPETVEGYQHLADLIAKLLSPPQAGEVSSTSDTTAAAPGPGFACP